MTDQPVLTKPIAPPPYFDPVAKRAQMRDLYEQHRGNDTASRLAVLGLIKDLLADAHGHAAAQLAEDGLGRHCAKGLSLFQDELLHLIYDFAVNFVYQATNPSDAERMSVVATGGYGRGLLAPGSDIDLLFLHPYKLTAWGESVVEYVLYLLWDAGFKVGHATRSVDQCVKLSKQDMTIRTALLDARLIFGDSDLFLEFQARFAKDVVAGTAREFIDAKMTERAKRHKRSGSSRYRVEPNIKDGKGGLRDLHTLHWLAKYIHGDTSIGPVADESSSHDETSGVLNLGIFTADEFHTFRKCEDFLWTIRCHLHFLTGRPEERMSFDLQPQLAQRLDYSDQRSMIAVERFMKHYFLVAKDVGDLTGILCAALEVQQLKTSPGLGTLLNPQNWRQRRKISKFTDFKVDNGRLNVANAKIFTNDPVNLIRIFAQAEQYDLALHPDAIRLLRRSLRLIDDELRADPSANRIFLAMLSAKVNPEGALRRMNEAGVLGRFIPEFGNVVCMMQFNMYHHFTVDEHLLQTVGVLSAIDRGLEAESHPLSTRLIGEIKYKRALYVAAFIHDIGKGREEDHSIIGAKFAATICPRLGLSPDETEIVVWLVREHLTMSNTAQSRDVSDPKTLADFADVVQTQERLDLLLILTVIDIRAVGPGTWNGWKGQLLRTLYQGTMPLVGADKSQPAVQTGPTQAAQIATVQADFRSAAASWPSEEVEHFISEQYPDYWLKTEKRKQLDHARLLQHAKAQGEDLAIDFITDAFTAITELSVLAPTHPRLLSMFTGACASAGANILGAQIVTTRSGLALDTFLLAREFDRDDDEKRRAGRICKTITQLLRGEIYLDALMEGTSKPSAAVGAFTVAPEVEINNTLSDQFTVMEVAGLDRAGLLYELTTAIAELNLDVHSAHITTFGEKAVDTFYVTDLTGLQVSDLERQQAIVKRLTAILSVEPAGDVTIEQLGAVAGSG